LIAGGGGGGVPREKKGVNSIIWLEGLQLRRGGGHVFHFQIKSRRFLCGKRTDRCPSFPGKKEKFLRVEGSIIAVLSIMGGRGSIPSHDILGTLGGGGVLGKMFKGPWGSEPNLLFLLLFNVSRKGCPGCLYPHSKGSLNPGRKKNLKRLGSRCRLREICGGGGVAHLLKKGAKKYYFRESV